VREVRRRLTVRRRTRVGLPTATGSLDRGVPAGPTRRFLAKPTRYATPICLGLTALAALGFVLGFVTDDLMWPVFLLIPTVAYEAYRTEGASTRFASWAMVVVMLALVAVVVFDIEYDLRELLGSGVTYVGGEDIPLGDVKVVFPAVMAILAVILWTRTRGIYTRWLAAIIFVTAGAIVYLRAPADLGNLLNTTVG
jgi:hypothetical protein